MRLSLPASVVLVVLLGGHVNGAVSQASATSAAPARGVVTAAIRERVVAMRVGGAVVDADVQFTRVSSLAVPGLVYWWGHYIPPNTADVWFEAVAGEIAGAVKRLESAEDWLALAVSAGWRPSSATAATEGCAEAVQVSSPERSQRFGNALMRLAVNTVNPNPSKDASNTPQTFRSSVPRATQTRVATWEVDFWMSGWGVHHYRCEISPATLRITRLESGPYWMMGRIRPGG